MEIVWAAAGASKRKRTSQACQPCRARKKKCYHDEVASRGDCDLAPDAIESTGGEEHVDFEEPQPEARTRESSADLARLQEYNPEALLKHLSSIHDQSQVAAQPGSTSSSRDRTAEDIARSEQKARRRQLWYMKYRRTVARPRLSDSYRIYLEDAGAMLELPRATSEGLFPIYISLLADLIPIMDASKVFRDLSNGQSSRYLVRAVCLITCKARQAASFLRLHESGPLLDHDDFASKLLNGLDAAIKADLESDRVTKVQILALMHLYNDGPGGVDRSSMYLSQAISEAWSMSLHLKMPENPDQELCDRLWWTLRNFDRLNKPTMAAAPFIIDDTDVCVDRVTPRADSYSSQVADVALIMGDLIGTATKVYKAGLTSTVDDPEDFPSLAELTAGTTFLQFHRAHRAYFEIWYHVAAMLSCRHSGPGTVHYKRRLDSADLILEMMGNGGHESLPPLPLVPYAIAFATTVIYRALRDRERPIELAFCDLRLCCNILDTVSQRWTSVRGVARLAKRLLGLDEAQTQPSASAFKRRHGVSAFGDELISGELSNRQLESQMSTEGASTDLLQSQQVHPEDTGTRQVLLGGHLVQPWTSTDTSDYQLNMSMDDLFDYGISDIFRDTLDFEIIGE